MQAVPNKPRRGSRYTEAERKVLSKYKDEYRSKTTAQEREQLLKQKVLVDIFNYWFSKEGTFPSEEESKQRVKVSYLICIRRCIITEIQIGTLSLDSKQLAIHNDNSSRPITTQKVQAGYCVA